MVSLIFEPIIQKDNYCNFYLFYVNFELKNSKEICSLKILFI